VVGAYNGGWQVLIGDFDESCCILKSRKMLDKNLRDCSFCNSLSNKIHLIKSSEHRIEY
jgi:hypothetical protein